MDSFIIKLRSLAKNRYFGYIAVIFLAAVTAIIITLINNQTKPDANITGATTPGSSPYYQSSNSSAPSSSSAPRQSSPQQKSIIDSVLESIGLKPKTSQNSTQQENQYNQSQSSQPGSSTANPQGKPITPTQTPEQKKASI